MHAVLLLSQLLAITKIHVQVIALVLHGIQTNFILFIIWTGANEIVYPSRIDSREIIFPVWDREVKNHTLSNGTSPYRPYKGVPPTPSEIVFGADFVQCVIKGAKDNTSDNHSRFPTDY